MTGNRNHRIRSLPLANYSSALAKAVEWLGGSLSARDTHKVCKPLRRRSARSRV
jgi:hypothetical protein